MQSMRTTLTLDRDVADAIDREMKRRRESLKTVVNEGLRRGLGLAGKPPEPTRFKVEPRSLGMFPGIDPDKLNQLVDELEVEERAAGKIS